MTEAEAHLIYAITRFLDQFRLDYMQDDEPESHRLVFLAMQIERAQQNFLKEKGIIK